MSFSSRVSQHEFFADKYTLYVDNIIFGIGLIGNILNIFVFAKLKLFRGNRCAFYLIVESIVDIALLCIITIPQDIQLSYTTDLGQLSLIWCKLRDPLRQIGRLLVGSIVCFEALDQFLSTNHRFVLQQISTLKLARYLILTATILWVLQTIPYIIFTKIVPPAGCIIVNQALIYYYSFVYYIFLNGLTPIFISSLFSFVSLSKCSLSRSTTNSSRTSKT